MPTAVYSMVPIKRTVFLLTLYGMKNTVRLIGTLEYTAGRYFASDLKTF